ncbi:hypothetical protein ACFL4O_02880 [bacterium]
MKSSIKKVSLVCGMLVFFSSLSYAAFTSVSITTITAVTEFNVAASGSMDIGLFEIDGAAHGASTPTITWSGISIGVTDWKAADAVIVVTNTYNHTGWGIFVYTDNIASNADPEWNASAKSTAVYNCAGLLRIPYDESVSTSTHRLKMCWRITDNTTDTYDIREDNGTLYDNTLGSGFSCFHFLKDLHTPDDASTTGIDESFDAGDDSAVIWQEGYGIHYATGSDWASAASPNYIYVGAQFLGAVTPAKYKTNQLKLELYWE